MSITSIHRPVVVGLDDRATSSRALDWAIEEASRRHLDLHLVHARSIAPGSRVDAAERSSNPAVVPAVLTAAVERAHVLAPTLTVTVASPVLRPATALLEVARDADTVVVGARGRGTLTGTLLGSTSLEVAAQASCPVVVVRELPQPSSARPSVVVGTDGAAVSSEAIGYAFAQASLRALPLTAVHVWVPEFAGRGVLPRHGDEDLRQLVELEQAVAAEELAGWSAKYPDVLVRRHVLRGHPVNALVDHSVGAELLVVGSRGRGGFTGMFMGSVSQGVLHHAHCPVAVVHPQANG